MARRFVYAQHSDEPAARPYGSVAEAETEALRRISLNPLASTALFVVRASDRDEATRLIANGEVRPRVIAHGAVSPA